MYFMKSQKFNLGNLELDPILQHSNNHAYLIIILFLKMYIHVHYKNVIGGKNIKYNHMHISNVLNLNQNRTLLFTKMIFLYNPS